MCNRPWGSTGAGDRSDWVVWSQYAGRVVAKGRERSVEELKRASEYVSYEYCQVARQLDRFASSELARSHMERGYISRLRPELIQDYDLDAHLRMYLSSFRAVVDFLAKESPRTTDVVASDFLPVEGDTFVAVPTDSMRKGIKLFERRAGHLTYRAWPRHGDLASPPVPPLAAGQLRWLRSVSQGL